MLNKRTCTPSATTHSCEVDDTSAGTGDEAMTITAMHESSPHHRRRRFVRWVSETIAEFVFERSLSSLWR